MTSVVLERKWSNSRGEVDGWSFVQDGETVHWTYRRLFDSTTQEQSWGEALFDLTSFRHLLVEFQQENKARLSVPAGGAVALSRRLDGIIEISVRAERGDGATFLLEAPQPGDLLPLGIDLAVKTGCT